MDWMPKVQKLLILGIVLSFLLALCPRASAQTDSYLKVTTDYELLGAQDLHGGGHVTYTLEGTAAMDLRKKVLQVYDGSVSPYVKNWRIEAAELKYSEGAGFVASVEHALEGTNFFAAGINAVDPLHEGAGEPITTDAEGFVGEDVNTSTAPINIYLYFDAREMAGGHPDVDMIAQQLFNALYTTLPAPWVGKYIFSHTDYRVGMTSFYNTRAGKGNIYVFRTPAGEISKYDVTFDSATFPTRENASYSSFDFLENPQVLFIVMFVCAYFTSAMPSKYWANYKLSHPRRYRHKAKKIFWLHLLSKILIIFMLLIYFIPNMFMVFGVSLFLTGIVVWIFGIVSTVVMAVLAKKYYDKLMTTIPEEPAPVARPMAPQPMAAQQAGGPVSVVVHAPAAGPSGPPCGMCKKPVESEAEMTKCVCGKVYHKTCIAGVKACPFCSEPFPGTVKRKDVQCPTCGEVNKVPEGTNLLNARCKACGVVMAKIEPGYNYLVVSKERSTVYNIMINLLKSQKMVGLCITSTFPEKVKKEYDLKNTEVIWMSDTTGDPTILNPKRLEFETMRTIGNFLKGRKDAVLILDGFEYLIVENGFEKVHKFIKKINDLSSVNHSTFLVPIAGESITPEQMGILRKEFDKVIGEEPSNGK